MKLKQVMISIRMLAIVTLTILAAAISPSIALAGATPNQSNQDINQSALLIAPDPDFQINVYAKPSADRRRIGYGSGGDTVTVREQVGSNEGYTWNYVRFDRSPHLEGWIREDYVALQDNVGETSGNQNRPHRFATKNHGWNHPQSNTRHGNDSGGDRQNSYQSNRYVNQSNPHQNNYQNSYNSKSN